MRKSILIGSGIVLLAGAAGWGWFMMSHPQSIHAIATGSLQGAGTCRIGGGTHTSESSKMSVIALEPVTADDAVPVSEPSDPPEVIDLTELQKIAQQPLETIEPPLAHEVPAVHSEPMSPDNNSVKPAHHEEASETVPSELSERQIPADFLQHSADGPPDWSANAWTVRWLQMLKNQFQAQDCPVAPPNRVPVGYDHAYHQQHPGCPYQGGCPYEQPYRAEPELLPEPTLLPGPGNASKTMHKNSKRGTLEIVPGDLPSFWTLMPF